MKKAKLDQQIEMVDRWIQLFSDDTTLNRPYECPSNVKIQNSALEKEIFSYLSNVVPTLLKKTNTGGVLRYKTDEEKFNELICKPFEQFIGNKDDPYVTLKEFSNPTKFCGKVFELGDPTYTCKDCASDPTCVFCHDCFHNSAHQNHKYKMFASSGSGGYCDCGDEEAWSSHPACDKHQDGMNLDDQSDPLENLPESLKRRAIIAICFVIQYCVDLVCWEENDVLPFPLTSSDRDENDEKYIVMLFNDESHTYDEVIETLKEAVPNCTSQQALHFATIVDKLGRSAIVTGDRDFCESTVNTCDRLTSVNGKPPLKCHYIHRDVIAHQAVAQSLMEWLLKLLQASDGIRRIHTILSTKQLHGRPNTILEQVIAMDVKLWKSARTHVHQLFMNGILMDIYGRQQFAIAFTKNYRQIMTDFIQDDHEHSVSVASLSVQIFTVPTLAQMLIEEYNALLICFDTFWNQVEPAKGARDCLDFQYNPQILNIRRVDFILRDIGYLLRHKPTWTEKLKTNFLRAFDKILQLLKAMQGMDPCIKQLKVHVAYEPNWENGMNLQIFFEPIVEMLLVWGCDNEEVFKAIIEKCVSALLNMYSNLKFTKYNGSDVCTYDVGKSPVSVHAPLSRLIAGMIPGMVNFPGLNVENLLQLYPHLDEKERRRTQVKLMEAPLRTLVLMAQVYSQMWRRNGYSLVHQVFYYHNVKFGTEMYDRDILLLQVMGAIMDPNHFLDVIIYKHQLADFFSGMKPSGANEDKTENKSHLVAREFFHLLYCIVGERYVSNISEVTLKEILCREVTHRLALGPATRSSLVKNLPTKDIDDEEDSSFEFHLDQVLKEVATYKNPGVDGKGTYELNKENLSNVHPYFIHYTRNEREKLVEQKKKHLKTNPNFKEFTQKEIPAFTSTFSNILRLFESDRMEFLLRCVLKNPEKFVSEETVEIVLLIIGIGLMEVNRNNLTNFISILKKPMEEGKNIKNLIEKLPESTQHYSGILKWLKQLLQEVVQEEVEQMETEQHSESKEEEKKRKRLLAQKQRAKMMAQMSNMQKAFLKSHKEFLTDEVDDSVEGMDVTDSKPNDFPVALGVNCSKNDSDIYSKNIQCILCQEIGSIDNDNDMFVITCFQQKSRVFPHQSDSNEITPQINEHSMTHVSSCGHILHSECWNKMTPSIFSHQRRSIDINQSEYLCPYCKSLCNTVLPMLPKVQEEKNQELQDIGLNEFLSYLERYAAELASVTVKPVDKKEKRRRSHGSFFSMGVHIFQTYLGLREIDSSENVMDLFAKKLCQINSIDERTESIPLMWMTFSFTMQAIECVHRESNTNMFSEVSDRQMTFLYAFVQYLSSSSFVDVYEPIQRYGSDLFSFFCGPSSNCSIFTMDIFGLMVSLRFLVSAVGNICQEKTHNFLKIPHCLTNDVVFRICLLAHLVKTILLTPPSQPEEMTDEENGYLIRIWKFLRSLTGATTDIGVNGAMLKENVMKSLMPYLRCCAMFFHLLTGVDIPDEVKSKSLDVEDEMKYLMKYLNLPQNIEDVLSVDSLRKDPLVLNMVERWCREASPDDQQTKTIDSLCYFNSRKLIDLPYQYSTLVKKYSGFKCPVVGDASRSPSLCLICGEMVCSQCYCCVTEKNNKRLGASAVHINECGNGVGVFLRIRDCEVYYLYKTRKGVFMAAPYLDKYGEPDRGLRRGNPLYLDKTRYERMQLNWSQHKIPSMVAQAMEQNKSLLAYEWNMI